jgi:hypothetical protein
VSEIPASSIPRAITELVKVASLGGGRGISLASQPRGQLGANGKPFEIFVKNMFAGCLGALSATVDSAWNDTFSWLGSANHPPDFMIKNGDAVEVKAQTNLGQIQLNSSPPKRTLRRDDPRITDGCRTCEEWTEKDFIYAIGKTNNEFVEALWLVEGRCIAAEKSTYDVIFDALSTTILALGGQQGNEIGRLNEVDALSATSLRVRGMWLLEHPARVFEEILIPPTPGAFALNVLVSADKWNRFDPDERQNVAALNTFGVTLNELEIRDSHSSDDVQLVVHIAWSVSI